MFQKKSPLAYRKVSFSARLHDRMHVNDAKLRLCRENENLEIEKSIECKTNMIPILIHQMRISTNYVSKCSNRVTFDMKEMWNTCPCTVKLCYLEFQDIHWFEMLHLKYLMNRWKRPSNHFDIPMVSVLEILKFNMFKAILPTSDGKSWKNKITK
jgi:hypothetical protein